MSSHEQKPLSETRAEEALGISRQKASEIYPESSPVVAEIRQALDILGKLSLSLKADEMASKPSANVPWLKLYKATTHLEKLLREELGETPEKKEQRIEKD